MECKGYSVGRLRDNSSGPLATDKEDEKGEGGRGGGEDVYGWIETRVVVGYGKELIVAVRDKKGQSLVQLFCWGKSVVWRAGRKARVVEGGTWLVGAGFFRAVSCRCRRSGIHVDELILVFQPTAAADAGASIFTNL